MTKFSQNCEIIITSSPKESSVGYPDLELRGGVVFCCLPYRLFILLRFSFFFYPKQKGGPSPKSATDLSFEFEFQTMHRWSKCKNFKRAFLCNLYIFVLFLLLRTTEIRKKCNNRIVKLFRKKRLGRGVCLSLVTRSLKRTHLASLLGSCSKFEMLQMLIHLMPDSLSTFVVVC